MRIMSLHPEHSSHCKSKTHIWWNHVPIGIMQRSENQEIEAGMASFTMAPSDHLGEFMLPISVTLDSVDLEILLLGATVRVLLNYKTAVRAL